MAVPLANKDFNPTGTIFEFKFVCFWVNWVQNLKEIKISDV